MFEQSSLISITESLYNIFENATVDTSVFVMIKNLFKKKYRLINSKLNGYTEIDFKIDSNNVFSFKKTNSVIEKVNSMRIKLNDVTEIWQGLIAYAGKSQPREWTSNTRETEFHRKLLYGKDVSKYGIIWSGEYLKYGKWLHRPRPSYIFDKEKILVQRIRNPQLNTRLVCAYDNNGYINGTGLSNILLLPEFEKEINLKYLLAILNSSLINYWFSFYYVDVNIKPEQLRNIPLSICNTFQQQSIVNIVEQIIENKRNNQYADTSALESEIDRLVYQLYGLTEEEIKIVEQS